MVDKKIASIAVLCMATVLFLGLWLSSTQETQRLEGELRELEDNYDKLARVRTSLEENYSELKTEKEKLEDDYSALRVDYSKLEEEYSILNSYYESLYSIYNSLKEDYDELHSILEEGRAIAESAEWVSEDKRLKVTSNLTSEYLFEEVTGYTVRVTITNVGNEPFDQVWIFLFPYVDGNLYEYWNPLSYAHSVENIYISETYSYDFTYLLEKMTSYKVLAVAG